MRYGVVRLASVAFKDRKGVTAMEYAVLAVVMVTAIAATAPLLGRTASNLLSSVIAAETQGGGNPPPLPSGDNR
ncbi:MAG TPA: Flp family type IVb pilin [Acetobacteraceae bacterium]|nr:Flp family type IVb pilin [Acetobacteraceae bacterium]